VVLSCVAFVCTLHMRYSSHGYMRYVYEREQWGREGFFWFFLVLSSLVWHLRACSCDRCMFTMLGGDVLIEREGVLLSFALLPLFAFEFVRATYCGVLVQDLAYYVRDPMVWWSLFGVWTGCVCAVVVCDDRMNWSFMEERRLKPRPRTGWF
jgi:hypothetical protein